MPAPPSFRGPRALKPLLQHEPLGSKMRVKGENQNLPEALEGVWPEGPAKGLNLVQVPVKLDEPMGSPRQGLLVLRHHEPLGSLGAPLPMGRPLLLLGFEPLSSPKAMPLDMPLCWTAESE